MDGGLRRIVIVIVIVILLLPTIAERITNDESRARQGEVRSQDGYGVRVYRRGIAADTRDGHPDLHALRSIAVTLTSPNATSSQSRCKH